MGTGSLKLPGGIIVALNGRHTRECMESVGSLGRKEQIFWGDFREMGKEAKAR